MKKERERERDQEDIAGWTSKDQYIFDIMMYAMSR